MNKKFKIIIIGSGNVAEHLIRSFEYSVNSEVVQVYSRNTEAGNELSPKFNIDFTNSLDRLKKADLYLIAVSDTAIAEVSNSLPFTDRLVAHTSGATSMDILNNKNKQAVFYPLQSFTKGKKIDFSNIPICIETISNEDCDTIMSIAESISNTVSKVSSEQRQYLHASAVFVNNFTNHMFHIGKEIADHHNVDFNLLKPLIKETVEKLEYKSPMQAQTGPAVRGDKITMEKHLGLIPDETHKEIYRLITESIFKTHN